MEFTGTTTAINSALNGLTYDPPADFDGVATISFLTEDFGNIGSGGAKTAESSLEVSILAVNDAPVITGPSLVAVTEDLPHVFDAETDSLFSIVDDAANASVVEGGQPGSVTTQLGVTVSNGTVRMSQLQGLSFLKGDSAGDSDLLMTGSFNLIRNALNGMTYTSNENYNGADTLTIEFNDMGHFGEGIAQTVSTSALLLVRPANDAPTDISLSPAYVDENKKAGTTVGKLTAIDPDEGDSHTFEIVGPADNMPPFTITGNTLKTTRALNAEDESLIEVLVSATDAEGAEFLKESIWVSVRNLNDPPTGISIDNDTVLEGEPAGTLVGNLTSIDSDGTLGRGLIGYWPFDDGQGDMVSDLRYSGNSNNGTIQNTSPTMWKSGKIGFALELDGSKRFVEIPHSDRYLIDSGTITIWYKHTRGQGALFSKDSSGYDTGGHLYLNMDNNRLKIRLQGVNTANTISMNSASAALNSRNQWHHAAMSFGSDGMVLYLDGEIMASKASYKGGLGSSSGGVGNKEPLVIGGNTLQSGDFTPYPIEEHLSGTVDEFRIYDRQLSQEEIFEVMEATNNTNDSHAYTIVSGVGDDDNASFSIDGNRLLTTGPLDHEAQDGYYVRIQTQDSAGDKFQQSLHIKTNVNDPHPISCWNPCPLRKTFQKEPR